MHISRTPQDWPSAAHGCVMALGNFDGVHQGHQAVIGQAAAIAKQQNRPLAVMSFEPHPRRFFKPDLPVLRICPLADKLRLLRGLGVDYLYLARFNAEFAAISAEAFVSNLLGAQLKVGHVVTGYNFAFGHKRGGDTDYLEQAAPAQGMGYSRVAAVADPQGDVYSSTLIREHLKAGNIAEAARLLGRPYCLTGPVIHGDARGRELGFPTANLRPSPLFLPAYGVYAVRFSLSDGRQWNGVANLGIRPTVSGRACQLESHLFDCDTNLYGLEAKVELCRFIRPEQRFDGLDALKAQIADDTRSAQRYFAKANEGTT